ncbi:hybrid sensor histidine kinase/response regulator [Pacificimonas flava]|uniref:histidine kinase n=2 Tax=Pacificimonas TaxID=1960290 RepID=A0A219B0S3_9SPHN|nr:MULTISPECIES: ATP-binding protein [Pacificimonas]MBZ6379630.1 response regulator [Pacificimonas aurantium]OWV31900.1 hybrid sensor histidine kinase/response regulator [Pacificimonas flava]
MTVRAAIFPEKRSYNKWAASETLEDYALRYTADSARRWSIARVANTAIGATAFLACEALGASITLSFGFANSVTAILAASLIMFVIGLPIAYYAAREGLDIDLLTRGAGFGYLGSTITSLIYATFTFLLFAIEASIMSVALVALTAMPLSLAYLLSALVILPIAFYGMRAITRFQAYSQPIWIVVQLLPIIYLLTLDTSDLDQWFAFDPGGEGEISLVYVGLAMSTLLSLLPQIGEQADYLRFLPQRRPGNGVRWWTALLLAGPGWTLIGALKLLVGSCLAVLALQMGVMAPGAEDPTGMFLAFFERIGTDSRAALLVTALFVIVCQMKINVTNAYAGSIAWSNFFSRLTHSHPGRVVWLVFNVLLALLLMLIGIFDVIHGVLVFFANLAAGWLGALAADLMVSKPLGLSPRRVEFKRAHLYDINPVGIGAMTLSIAVSSAALGGMFGEVVRAFAPAIGLATAFVAAPAIALITHGRYYIARQSTLSEDAENAVCVICENRFQAADMAGCPLYSGPICSLCCTLEAKCHDVCKDGSRLDEQVVRLSEHVLPGWASKYVHTNIGHFALLHGFFCAVVGAVLYAIYLWWTREAAAAAPYLGGALAAVFTVFVLLSGVAAWLIVLAHDSRRSAERETGLHLESLSEEIAAHEATDVELQRAKGAAEAANEAKSRYLTSVSHEIRSPLNSIYGYAQLLERDRELPPQEAAQVIRRSCEHLTNMVDGLLDISQVESGVLRLSRDLVNLPLLADEIADMFAPQAEAKGVTFLRDIPAALPDQVHTDRKRLRQILINLCSNAVKFTERGSVSLRVTHRSEIATFEISDTGLGIGSEDLKRIFEPFDRGGNPATLEFQGIGLGLAITQALVQIMGGEMTVRSEPGAGTTFTVKLMLSKAEGGEPVRSRSRATGYSGPRKRVLIADDSRAQLRVLASLLRPLGFEVSTFDAPLAALEAARREPPDLALLDISMPGLDGWQLASGLRAQLSDQVKIVMVSANAHELGSFGSNPAVHDAFLAKPVDLDLLLDLIGRQLGVSWTYASGIQAAATDEKALDLSVPSACAGAEEDELPPRAGAYLQEILELSRIGHVRRVEAAIATMEAALPESAKMTARLRTHLEQFDFTGLAKTLEAELSNA